MGQKDKTTFRMPPEWHPHECCWMQWPTDDFPSDVTASWSNFDIEKGRVSWANVANHISEFEELKMIVHPNNTCLLYTSPSPRD